MPLLVYSLLRLALFGACWAVLVWVGLNPWAAVVVAAFVAWGLSYVVLSRPRDAAARWLADQAAKRKGVPQLSARARQDAADEDALVAAQEGEPADEDVPAGDAAPPPGHGGTAAPDPAPGSVDVRVPRSDDRAAPADAPGVPAEDRAELSDDRAELSDAPVAPPTAWTTPPAAPGRPTTRWTTSLGDQSAPLGDQSTPLGDQSTPRDVPAGPSSEPSTPRAERVATSDDARGSTAPGGSAPDPPV